MAGRSEERGARASRDHSHRQEASPNNGPRNACNAAQLAFFLHGRVVVLWCLGSQAHPPHRPLLAYALFRTSGPRGARRKVARAIWGVLMNALRCQQ
jgi:hypothetical protein